jgi:hypothetical protein
MKEQFVTYEIALKLKELRFNEPCIVHYFIDSEDGTMGGKKEALLRPLVTSDGILTGIEPTRIDCNLCAPLWQQAIDWLNEHPRLPLFKDHVKYESCKENLEGRILRAIEKIQSIN